VGSFEDYMNSLLAPAGSSAPSNASPEWLQEEIGRGEATPITPEQMDFLYRLFKQRQEEARARAMNEIAGSGSMQLLPPPPGFELSHF
jgi:hypothetical protein